MTDSAARLDTCDHKQCIPFDRCLYGDNAGPTQPLDTAAGVTLPRAIVKVLVDQWPLCGVCTGRSPSWDGHDVNPPCVGYAREQAKVALDG